MSIGIYKITNQINNKCYIGQSINIEDRWQYHKAPSHWDPKVILYAAFLKYGIENFTFEIIEYTSGDKQTLNEREKYWIEYYQSYTNKGYNATKGGDNYSIKYSLISNEEIKDIRTRKIKFQSPTAVFELYKNKISWATFDKIWNGTLHPEVMSEIYQNKENLKFIERVLKQRMNFFI